MKRLFILFVALFAGCTDSLDDTPKTRTVFFGTATLGQTGREVRVMIDTLHTRWIGILVTPQLRAELNLTIVPVSADVMELQRERYPFYDVVNGCTCLPFEFDFAGKRCGGAAYLGGCEEVWNFARQEQLTGEHIDMVVGFEFAYRTFGPTESSWAEKVGGDGRNLLNYHTDKALVVPYDWGTSRE